MSMILIRLSYLMLLFGVINCSTSQKQQKTNNNPVDNIECQWEKDQPKVKKILGQKNIDKEESKSVCKGEKAPVSERLNRQLKKDGATLKKFFNFDQDSKKKK